MRARELRRIDEDANGPLDAVKDNVADHDETGDAPRRNIDASRDNHRNRDAHSRSGCESRSYLFKRSPHADRTGDAEHGHGERAVSIGAAVVVPNLLERQLHRQQQRL